MSTLFKKATKSQSRLRLALVGVSGSGKTYSSLAIATQLGKKIAFIDTEHGSAALYSDFFNFDVLELAPPFTAARFVSAIQAASAEKYDVIIVDSLSHAWAGQGGLLDKQAALDKSGKYKNSFTSWRDITPDHDLLVNTMLRSPAHIIGCMRAKTEYAIEKDEKGRTTVRKIGLAPVQREGLEYEFTTVLDVSNGGYATASKDRTRIFSQTEAVLLGEKTGVALLQWLESGAPMPEPVAPADYFALLESVSEAQSTANLSEIRKENQNLIDRLKATQPDLHKELVQAFIARGEEIKNPAAESEEDTAA